MTKSRTKARAATAFSVRFLLLAMLGGIFLALLSLWWLRLGFENGKAAAATLATVLVIGTAGELVRRRFHISLRMLLVAFTVLAVLMGLYGRHLVDARKQERIVTKIRRLGGSVQYDFGTVSGNWIELNNGLVIPSWCRTICGSDLFACVSAVSFNGNSLTNDDLQVIRQLPYVESLDLTNTGFTASALKYLARCKVKTVWLNGRQATSTGFAYLKMMPNLENLILSGPGITDETLSQLQGPPTLKKLSLWSTTVTGSGLTHMDNIEGLEFLNLNGCQVGDAGLMHLSRLNKLCHLHLERLAITDAGIVQLKNLKQLQSLGFFRTTVTSEGVETLQEAMPWCELRVGGGQLIDSPASSIAETDAGPEPTIP